MELYISSKSHNLLSLELRYGKTVVDTVDFGFDKDLDTRLIKSIDNFMKRNRIDIHTLSAIHLPKNVDPASSAYKILATWLAAVKTVQKR